MHINIYVFHNAQKLDALPGLTISLTSKAPGYLGGGLPGISSATCSLQEI